MFFEETAGSIKQSHHLIIILLHKTELKTIPPYLFSKTPFYIDFYLLFYKWLIYK
jgi:hypothetical protein